MNESLIEKARAGDKEAENYVFAALRESFILIAKHRLRDAPHRTHEDIVQEACSTVLEKYRTERFDKGFMQWAYGVLRNKIGNAYQQTSRHADIKELNTMPSIVSIESKPEIVIAVRRCFESMVRSNVRYARVINLAHQGYTTDEICQRLSLTPQNCHTLLSRVRAKLRECLERSGVSL